jgi:hypothetical protein
LDYTYTVNKILFVFTSSILLAEEFFKLYRIIGDSLRGLIQSIAENQGICFIEGVAFIPCQSCKILAPCAFMH